MTFTLTANFDDLDGTADTQTTEVTIASNVQVISPGGAIFSQATVPVTNGVLSVTLPDNTADPGTFGFIVRREYGYTRLWRVPVQAPGATVDLSDFTDTTPLPIPASLESRVEGLEAAPGGVTDHGALTGLGDDDHSQYLNNARGDARYQPLATFTENVQDVIGASLVEGTNVTLTYNDGAGTVTIDAAGGGGGGGIERNVDGGVDLIVIPADDESGYPIGETVLSAGMVDGSPALLGGFFDEEFEWGGVRAIVNLLGGEAPDPPTVEFLGPVTATGFFVAGQSVVELVTDPVDASQATGYGDPGLFPGSYKLRRIGKRCYAELNGDMDDLDGLTFGGTGFTPTTLLVAAQAIDNTTYEPCGTVKILSGVWDLTSLTSTSLLATVEWFTDDGVPDLTPFP